MPLPPQTLSDAGLALAATAGEVANYCDHVEHNEPADPEVVRVAGEQLRRMGFKLSWRLGHDPLELYARRLEAIESRNVLWSANSLDGAQLARSADTWRALQLVQVAHDRAYHADVVGMAKIDQLRHYALHLAKLAGATAAVARGEADQADWLERRVPDMLLFGLKLSTVSGEKLPEDHFPGKRSVEFDHGETPADQDAAVPATR
jgi:hypothetical protein